MAATLPAACSLWVHTAPAPDRSAVELPAVRPLGRVEADTPAGERAPR
jgi:hypothetical protein